jgi:hypothetical protein
MPNYVPAALHKFRHDTPTSREDAPSKWNQPAYGAKIQYAPDLNSSTPFNKSQVTRLQQVMGTLMYYSIAVDPAIGIIAAVQSNATNHTVTAVVKLLNHAATNPNAIIRYKASGKTLYAHSDASYLSDPKRTAALAATSISATNQLIQPARQSINRPTTPPSTPPATSSATSWSLPPSPKWVPSSSTAKRPFRSTMPQRTRPSATSNARTNRQLDRRRLLQQHHQTKALESHGYAFFLEKMPCGFVLY